MNKRKEIYSIWRIYDLSEWKTLLLVNASNNVSIYFVPHPDDEVLTYSVPIENDLRAGKKVYLVLLTAGEDSIALRRINERVEPDLYEINLF